MNFYRGRPLALAVTFFIAHSVVLSCLPSKLKLFYCALIFLLIPLLFVFLRRRLITFVCGVSLREFTMVTGVLIAAATLTSFLYYDVYAARYDRMAASANTYTVSATVLEAKYESNYASTYLVRLNEVDGDGVHAQGLLLIDAAAGLSTGDTVETMVEFVPLNQAYEMYDVDKRDMLADRYVFACEAVEEVRVTGQSGGLDVMLSRLRGRMGAALSLYVNRDTAALSKALLLADRSELGVIRRDFTRIGVSHLLALSGLHVTILCGGLTMVLRRLKVRRHVRTGLEIVFVLLFIALTGFQYSVMRAGLMYIMLSLSSVFGRKGDAITALFAVGAAIVIFDPPSICDKGFALSFVGTLGVLLISRELSRVKPRSMRRRLHFNRVYRWVIGTVDGLIVSAGAVMFITPLVWLFFGETSLLTIPATLIMSFFCQIMLTLLPPYLLLSLVGWSFLAGRVGWILELLCQVMTTLSAGMSAVSTPVSLKYPFVLPIILVCAAVIVGMMILDVDSWLWALIPFGLSCVVFMGGVGIWQTVNADTSVLRYVNYGENDAFVLVSENRAMVVDATIGSSVAMRSTSLVMAEEYMTEVDTCLLTHLHRRHINSLRALMNTRLVRRILLPEPENESEANIAADLSELAETYGARLIFYPRPASITFGQTTLTLPSAEYLKRSTHPLLGIRFMIGGRDTVYVGRSFWEGEAADEFVSGADFLIMGNHGPVMKSEPDFVFETPPAYIYGTSSEMLDWASGKSTLYSPPTDKIGLRIEAKP